MFGMFFETQCIFPRGP